MIAAMALFLGADTPSPKNEAGDHHQIQGKWTVVAHGKSFVIPINERTFGSKLVYTLRETTQPKEIDLVHRRPRERPRVMAKGIYALEKDTLKICWRYQGARPRKFESRPKHGQYLLTLKRIRDR